MEFTESQLKKITSLMQKKYSENEQQNCYVDISGDIFVYTNNANYGYEMKWQTVKGAKMQLLTESKNKVIADDYDCIDANSCRMCKKEIKPFNKIYFKKINENTGFYWFRAYGFYNNYCESCAKEQADTVKEVKPAPRLIKTSERWLLGDKYPTKKMEFEGFTLESNDAWKKIE